MIPLLLVFGLGAVALTVYGLSPKTRSGVDAFVRAISSANAAHQTADAHLRNANAAASTAVRHTQKAVAARQAAPSPRPAPTPAQWMPTGPVQWVPTGPVQWVQMPTTAQPSTAPAPIPTTPTTPTIPTSTPTTPPLQPVPQAPPVTSPTTPQVVADAQANAAQVATDVAVDNVAAAIEANRQAAKDTGEAAKNAQDEAQRRATAQSAAKVLERDRQIAEALNTLGLGQCGVKTYYGITERAKNMLLVKLREEGMGVTGGNPLNIDTHQYGVKLRAVWDPRAQEVKLIVTTGKGAKVDPFGLKRVGCPDIWAKIDPIMKEVSE